MFFEFFKWWYGAGWLDAWHRVGPAIKRVQLAFAIPVLLRSLFAPWKRIITVPGRSLDEHFKAAIDNLVSRTVGFTVRFITLLSAMLVIGLSAIFYLSLVLLWPLIPLALVLFVIKAVIG